MTTLPGEKPTSCISLSSVSRSLLFYLVTALSFLLFLTCFLGTDSSSRYLTSLKLTFLFQLQLYLSMIARNRYNT